MPPTLNTAKKTDITIVVCTYDRQDMLRNALESLSNLTGPGFEYEILVVDDGSVDETPAVVQSIMNASPVNKIRYMRQDNRGVAAARNTGVRNARGQWIAFFDDDQLADRDWLVHLVAAAQSTGADCVGGPYLLMLPRDSGIFLSQTLRRLLGENPVMREQLPNKGWRIDPRRHVGPGTGNALVRKELFDRIGLFSEVQRPTACEDLQFFRRARKSGARFAIAPGAIIHHVIPLHRLTPDYLLSLAGRSGASWGQIDTEVLGTARALWDAAMRAVHLTLWTLPGLFAFWLLRDHNRVLSKKCSARFATECLAAVARSKRRRLAG